MMGSVIKGGISARLAKEKILCEMHRTELITRKETSSQTPLLIKHTFTYEEKSTFHLIESKLCLGHRIYPTIDLL